MRLQEIRTYTTVPPAGVGGSFWVFVEVETDDGITGVGSATEFLFQQTLPLR